MLWQICQRVFLHSFYWIYDLSMPLPSLICITYYFVVMHTLIINFEYWIRWMIETTSETLQIGNSNFLLKFSDHLSYLLKFKLQNEIIILWNQGNISARDHFYIPVEMISCWIITFTISQDFFFHFEAWISTNTPNDLKILKGNLSFRFVVWRGNSIFTAIRA